MKIRELFESMDGVSPGTHMFTSEETRGSARTFGAEAMAGIKNKERILRAASFVTKQRNHPQNQARLVRRNSDSQRGYEEVVTLSVEDTKLWAKKLQDFFRNPANNIKHKELYHLLSDPTDSTKIQGLVNLIASSNQGVAEANPNQQLAMYNPDGQTYRGQKMPRPDPNDIYNVEKPVGLDTLRNEPADDPNMDQSIKNLIKARMDVLSPVERKVLQLRYWHDMTLEDIGELLGVNKGKISQIIVKAMHKMIKPSEGLNHKELMKMYVPESESEYQLNEKRKKRKKARRSVRGPVFYGGYGIFTGDSGEGEGGGVEESQLDEKWSEKYKRSINCSNPKGFSQRAHCQGRKKSSSKKPIGEAAVGSITSGQLEVLIDEHALDRARERGVDPAAVDYIIKKQMPEVLSKLSQLASGEKFWVYDWSRETALGLRRISSSELKFVLKTVWPGKPAQTPTVTKIIRT
jgi:RNA polymerase sigma factor (sigma-70 family)